MAFVPSIQAFCCHYTCQQACAQGGESLKIEGFPENVTINRYVCSGKVEVSTLLEAFEKGADGVYVVGCPEDSCHNVMGSQRAAKRVAAVRKALEELGVEPDRIAMYHLPRGLHPEFIAAAVEMNEKINDLGPSPLKGGAE